ncbi:MAG: hypothetical protein HQL81_05500 [Magnetococcales bacterium]|nr:hypothetical protein [Magnetococcales bacterium]
MDTNLRQSLLEGNFLDAWRLLQETWKTLNEESREQPEGQKLRGWRALLLQMLAYRLDLIDHHTDETEHWHFVPLEFAIFHYVNMQPDERKALAAGLRVLVEKGLRLPDGYGFLELAARLGKRAKEPTMISLGCMLAHPNFPEWVGYGAKILLEGNEQDYGYMTSDYLTRHPVISLCTLDTARVSAFQWLEKTFSEKISAPSLHQAFQYMNESNKTPPLFKDDHELRQAVFTEMDSVNRMNSPCDNLLVWYSARYVEALVGASVLPPCGVGYYPFGSKWNRAITLAAELKAEALAIRVTEWVSSSTGHERIYDICQILRGILQTLSEEKKPGFEELMLLYFQEGLEKAIADSDLARAYSIHQEWLRLEKVEDKRDLLRDHTLRYYCYETRMAGSYFGASRECLKQSILSRVQDDQYAVKRWSYYLLMPLFAVTDLNLMEEKLLNDSAVNRHEQEALAWGKKACANVRRSLEILYSSWSQALISDC